MLVLTAVGNESSFLLVDSSSAPAIQEKNTYNAAAPTYSLQTMCAWSAGMQ